MTGSKSSIRSIRRPLIAALALGVAVALAACSSPTTTPDTSAAPTAKALRIGFSPFSMQIPAFIGLAQGLTAIAGAQGDTVVTADAKTDPSTQLQQLQAWVDLGQVDAIWVIPVAAPAVASALVAAQAKGIVVIASGVPSDYGFSGPQAGMTFTNVDQADFGKQLGDLSSKCINERLGGKADVVYIASPSGAQSSAAINDGVKAAVASGSPAATFVSSLDSTQDRLSNGQQIATAIQGNPTANVFIGTDDESSLGALDAVAQAGLDPAKICVVGAGGNDEAKQAVKDGKIYGEVAFDFQADIAQNVGEIHKLAADPSANGSQLVTPITVITK